jgi:hypothetical protein
MIRLLAVGIMFVFIGILCIRAVLIQEEWELFPSDLQLFWRDIKFIWENER